MRVLTIGAGGVGGAVAAIARRRSFVDHMTLADVDAQRAAAIAARMGDDARYGSGQVDASDEPQLAELIAAIRPDAVLNATDPRFNEPIFDACLATGTTYLDMAMTLSEPHPERPYEEPGIKLGDAQFARAGDWEEADLLALVGIGVEPGLSDVFARHAADHLFDDIDEVGVRDGADLVIDGYDFAPNFSIWTTIEECLNPPLLWERERGWYTTAPFSDRLGLDSTEPVDVRGTKIAPRDVVAAALPDPATLGDRMHGRTCAGTYVTGSGKDARPRATYLYHVADNEQTMREDGAPGRRVADRHRPAGRPRAHPRGRLERGGRPGPGGLRRRPVPGTPGRLRRAPRGERARAVGVPGPATWPAPAGPQVVSRPTG